MTLRGPNCLEWTRFEPWTSPSHPISSDSTPAPVIPRWRSGGSAPPSGASTWAPSPGLRSSGSTPSARGGDHSLNLSATHRRPPLKWGPITLPPLLSKNSTSPHFPHFASILPYSPLSLPLSSQEAAGEDEEDRGDHVVDRLKSGEAAEVAAMQVLGRRGRYNWEGPHGRLPSKLTPGTVKYAAYFVLAVEGPGGLTVPQLAQKIQVRSSLLNLILAEPSQLPHSPPLPPPWKAGVGAEGPEEQQESGGHHSRGVCQGRPLCQGGNFHLLREGGLQKRPL